MKEMNRTIRQAREVNTLNASIGPKFRAFGWTAIIGCMTIAILREGIWFSNDILMKMGYASVIGVGPVVIVSACVYVTDKWRRGSKKPGSAFVMLLGMFLAAVLLARLGGSSNTSPPLRLYLVLFQAPLWGLVLSLCVDSRAKAEWLFDRLAFVIAVISVVSLLMRVAGLGGRGSIIGIVRWPIFLLFTFGYLWYLSKWIGGVGLSARALVGVVVCGLEVMNPLAKPLFISAVIASCVLIAILTMASGSREVLKRSLCAICVVVVAISAAFVMNPGGMAVWTDEVQLRLFHAQTSEFRDDLGGAVRGLAGGRFELWEGLADEIRENYIFGSGFGQGMLIRGNQVVSLHNGYLELLLGAGILGCVSVAIGLMLWLRRILTSMRDSTYVRCQAACVAYLCAVAVYNIGGSIFVFTSPLIFVFMVCGAAAGAAGGATVPIGRGQRGGCGRGSFRSKTNG